MKKVKGKILILGPFYSFYISVVVELRKSDRPFLYYKIS